MPLIVAVQFRPKTKPYHFGCEDLPDLSVGDYVLVETSRGRDVGVVRAGPMEVAPEDVIGELKPVLRRATSPELFQMKCLWEREPEALQRCRELVREHKLPMKVLKAEYNYDGSRLMFYFSAEGRVDFRDLVRGLARNFRTRIDLHQVGVRDEAKLVGDQGICGRLLCCRDWLQEFSKVSIRMAKHQNLSLNPLEISGACGRLLCCLAYEDDYYVEMRAALPKRGDSVATPEGPGVVTDVNVIRETVSVRLEDERIVQVPVSEVDRGS
ncbi:MAG: PSP1 domain-containing protein [Anaerolineae bacterium]|jgi:cell fate regulator YaaT (PSP1 superfamily)